MKSAMSFFNAGLSRNLLKRTWPVWAAHFLLLLLALPVNLSNTVNRYITNPRFSLYLEKAILDSAVIQVFLSFGFGIVIAMAVFSFLYQPRTCGMICSMPVRRETLFTTYWLSGLLPLLCSDLAAVLITAAAWSRYLTPVMLLKWLGITVMGNVAFYGFACFCAMLTGSLVILPLVYLVLSFAAVIFQETVRAILYASLFGYTPAGSGISFLSPIVYLMEHLSASFFYVPDAEGISVPAAVSVDGIGCLTVLFLVGLLFSLAALLLFRNRRMETAQDTVSVNCLKPVFRYCMAFGCAAAFTAMVMEMFLSGANRFYSPVLIAFLLIFGAFLGYFGAKMILQKSVRVFQSGWKGFSAVCAVCLLFVFSVSFDLFGYESRLPDLSQVTSAEIAFSNVITLKEPDNLKAAAELQQQIVAHKDRHRRSEVSYLYSVAWYGQDGELLLARSYQLDGSEDALADPLSDIRSARDLICCREAVLSRNTPDIPVTPDTVVYGELCDEETGTVIEITPEETVALYREGILPDLEAGRLGNSTFLDEEMGIGDSARISVWIMLSSGNDKNYVSLEVLNSSVLTLEKISQLTDSGFSLGRGYLP